TLPASRTERGSSSSPRTSIIPKLNYQSALKTTPTRESSRSRVASATAFNHTQVSRDRQLLLNEFLTIPQRSNTNKRTRPSQPRTSDIAQTHTLKYRGGSV